MDSTAATRYVPTQQPTNLRSKPWNEPLLMSELQVLALDKSWSLGGVMCLPCCLSTEIWVVCMSTLCLKKSQKTAHSSNREKGRLRNMSSCATQSTSKLMDYLQRERCCWGPFGERDSSNGEIGTLADNSISFCCDDCSQNSDVCLSSAICQIGYELLLACARHVFST